MEPDHEPGAQGKNRLAREKSPYLLDHAANPVDWYPWGEEAFSRARAEQRPVFLSIGYATCHWCHVMARESFMDPGIAAILNRHFIAVKVDREERPDIDSLYMTACQQLTGQGGWPLTLILTPEQKPFFAATYLPPHSRAGMTGLAELLEQAARLWEDDRDHLGQAAERITRALADLQAEPGKSEADRTLLREGFGTLTSLFDPLNGGFGSAPKFPSAQNILFLLRYWKRTGSPYALTMVTTTLDALRCGGIHDHVGGGFHRYATDAAWRVPHFEKMLTDQALLLTAFTEAWLATKNPEYQNTAIAIAEYVLRDMRSPEGGFFTAEDADSDGQEGLFYIWTLQETESLLGNEDARFFARHFGITGPGNAPSLHQPGQNVLFLAIEPDEGSRDRIDGMIRKLADARQHRHRPARDEKILADANGMMIRAFALAYRAFGISRYHEAAAGCMQFLLSRMNRPDGGLFHRYFEGTSGISGFCDDYAHCIAALIDLYESDFDRQWLLKAIALDQFLAAHFSDPDNGGCFTTSGLEDPLILRKKEFFDSGIPSPNAVILENLVRLWHLTADPAYQERARALAGAMAAPSRQVPAAASTFFAALDLLLCPSADIVIVGRMADPGTGEMLSVIRSSYLPFVSIHRAGPDEREDLARIAPFTAGMQEIEGRTTAYVCTGTTCQKPVITTHDLEHLLEQVTKKG